MSLILKELRSSRRVVRRVPLCWSAGEERATLHTVMINGGGALVVGPRNWERNEVIELENLHTGRSALFRVIWRAGEDAGRYRMGLAFMEEHPGFWGEDYPEAT
jgi:hypothetical protein